MRELKVEFPVPNRFREWKVRVEPFVTEVDEEDEDDEYYEEREYREEEEEDGRRDFRREYLGHKVPHIVGLESALFSLNTTSPTDNVIRYFEGASPIKIAEQSGETIIRHIWDAGVLFSALVDAPSHCYIPDDLAHLLEMHLHLDYRKRILEIGTGVGILGVKLATHLNTPVVMTDLPDAKALVEENIRINNDKFNDLKRNAQFRELDWEKKPYPEWTKTEEFDLVVMADVTYNTATFVPLADTLEHLLRHGAKGAKVVCCGKRRHGDEEEFWKLVQMRGFILKERITYGIGLDGEMQRRYPGGRNNDGDQFVDFVVMTLP